MNGGHSRKMEEVEADVEGMSLSTLIMSVRIICQPPTENTEFRSLSPPHRSLRFHLNRLRHPVAEINGDCQYKL